MPSVSVIVTCRGRLDAIKETIKPTIALPDTQYTFVDYGCPDHSGDWVEKNYKQARVIRVTDKPFFNLSDARNAGAEASTEPWLLFFDADVLPRPEFHGIIAAPQQGFFYKINHGDMPAASCLNGACLVARSSWEFVGGYDSILSGWGPEDIDFYNMLELSGLRQVLFPPRTLFHVPHEEVRRTEHYEESSRWTSQMVGWLYIALKNDVAKLWSAAIPASYRQTLYEMAAACIEDGITRGNLLPVELDLGKVSGWPTGSISRKIVYQIRSDKIKKGGGLSSEIGEQPKLKYRGPPV